jgi:hypothetical protein
MKLLILSPSSTSFAQVAAITNANKAEYSVRHKVDFLSLDYPDAATDKGYGRPAFWLKHLPDCDWLMNMDADAMFTNMTINARDYCLPDADIACSWDCMGFHSGVMFLRNCGGVQSVLEEVIRRKDIDSKLPDFMASSDQGCMVRVLSGRETYENGIPVAGCQASGVRVVEVSKTINRYFGDWKKGDFIFHTPGMSVPEKISLLTHRAREVVR